MVLEHNRLGWPSASLHSSISVVCQAKALRCLSTALHTKWDSLIFLTVCKKGQPAYLARCTSCTYYPDLNCQPWLCIRTCWPVNPSHEPPEWTIWRGEAQPAFRCVWPFHSLWSKCSWPWAPFIAQIWFPNCWSFQHVPECASKIWSIHLPGESNIYLKWLFTIL